MTCKQCNQPLTKWRIMGYCDRCVIDIVSDGERLHWLSTNANRATQTPDGWRIYWRQRGLVRQAEAITLAEAVDLAMQEQEEIEHDEAKGFGA